jgi:peptidoglycan hydrolase CwlO-like protein
MDKLELISEKITNFVGTPVSILIHTFLFIGIFMLKIFGYTVDQILLILTTAVSLEAIYLSIFIQMSVNKTSKSLAGVEKDIDDIQEDVDDIQEDVEDLNSDEDEEDEMIKTIQDIEKRLTLLHKEIVEISNKKN